MPARTNEFQRLILTIEQLTAAVGATVEESVMLEDLGTGAGREVDVLVTVPGGPRAVRVGVECRDHARPADVTWLEQLRTKYDSLPVDRVVAVSRRGFTPEALAKARLLKIDTLSLADAEAYDWAAAVRGINWMRLSQHQFVAVNVNVVLLPGVPAPAAADLWALEIAYADGTRRTVRAFCEWMSSQDFFKDAEAQVFRALPDETSAAPVQYTVRFPCEPAPFAGLLDAAGAWYPLEAVITSGECRRTVARVPVEQATVGGAAIFHGQAQVGETSVRFAAGQREGGAARLRVTLEHGGTVLPVETTLVHPDSRPPAAPAAGRDEG